MDGVIASTVSNLTITISDQNDNGPEFYECDDDDDDDDTCTQKNSFTGNVDEHSSAGLAVAELNITVKDPDQVCSYNACMVSSEEILCVFFFFFFFQFY